MGRRTTKPKTVAQLEREIDDSLARRTSTTFHLDRGVEDDWDVAMDALLEHDVTQASKIVNDIKRRHGLQSMTDSFSKALAKSPADVRKVFWLETNLKSHGDYDWKEFADGAAKAFWEDKYRSEVENLESADAREALSYGGETPDPSREARALGKRFATAVRNAFNEGEFSEVSSKFPPSEAGYYGAMQSMGHGVGWHDRGAKINSPKRDDKGSFEFDVKLDNSVWDAIKKKAREEGVSDL